MLRFKYLESVVKLHLKSKRVVLCLCFGFVRLLLPSTRYLNPHIPLVCCGLIVCESVVKPRLKSKRVVVFLILVSILCGFYCRYLVLVNGKYPLVCPIASTFGERCKTSPKIKTCVCSFAVSCWLLAVSFFLYPLCGYI